MRARPSDVTAVIVTRGNVDLTEIRQSLEIFGDLVVWDNTERLNVKVYGRYVALHEARNPIAYVQDDDCVLTPDAIEGLLEMYEPGVITANMPASRWDDYPDSCLVGWGAVFDAALPPFAFTRWRAFHSVTDERFLRECDVVFTTLTPHRKIDLGFQHLPWAEGPDRMWTGDPGRKRRRDETYAMARAVRDARA